MYRGTYEACAAGDKNPRAPSPSRSPFEDGCILQKRSISVLRRYHQAVDIGGPMARADSGVSAGFAE